MPRRPSPKEGLRQAADDGSFLQTVDRIIYSVEQLMSSGLLQPLVRPKRAPQMCSLNHCSEGRHSPVSRHRGQISQDIKDTPYR